MPKIMSGRAPRYRGVSALLSAALMLVLLMAPVSGSPLLAQYGQQVSPQELYHTVWETVPQYTYDPSALKQWSQYEHKYDSLIKTDDDAVKYANQMLKVLHDRYTMFLSAQQVHQEREMISGQIVGIGVYLEEDPVEKCPIVRSPIEGGPAQKAGILSGDIIERVDGKSVKGMSLPDASRLIRGTLGVPVAITVLRHGVTLTFTIVRDTVVVPAVTYKHLPGGIGYIRLYTFMQNDCDSQFRQAMLDLKDCKALIIDVRSNGGGFISKSVAIASMCLESGTIYSERERQTGGGWLTTTVKLTPTELVSEETNDLGLPISMTAPREPNLSGNRPVMLLVNGYTASASEIFTGALKDNGRVTVVGSKTFGKGIGQMLVPMPNNTELHITSLHLFQPNGTWIGDGGNSQSNGIVPDVVIKPAKKDFTIGGPDDNQLESTVKLLLKKLNLPSP